MNNSQLLHKLFEKKKKVVPIIPPPGPGCRSSGDPFGSDTADITAIGHTSRDGGYSREEPGRPLSHICPGPCAVLSCRCQRGYP